MLGVQELGPIVCQVCKEPKAKHREESPHKCPTDYNGFPPQVWISPADSKCLYCQEMQKAEPDYDVIDDLLSHLCQCGKYFGSHAGTHPHIKGITCQGFQLAVVYDQPRLPTAEEIYESLRVP